MMVRGILIAAMLVSPSVAQAQRDREQAPQIVLPNQEPRGERSYGKGEDILRTPLRWTLAAIPQRSLSVTIAGEPFILNADAPLPLVAVQEQRRAGPFIQAFCTPRKSPPRGAGIGAMGLLGAALMQSWTDAQTCAIDKDRDGRFDHAMLIGAGGAEERVLYPVAPTPYRIGRDLPNSTDDEMRIRVSGVSAKKVTFILDIVQRGEPQKFQRITGDDGVEAWHVNAIRLDAPFPIAVEIFGADFEIVAVDPPKKQVTIRWPDAAPRDARRTIPDVVRYGF